MESSPNDLVPLKLDTHTKRHSNIISASRNESRLAKNNNVNNLEGKKNENPSKHIKVIRLTRNEHQRVQSHPPRRKSLDTLSNINVERIRKEEKFPSQNNSINNSIDMKTIPSHENDIDDETKAYSPFKYDDNIDITSINEPKPQSAISNSRDAIRSPSEISVGRMNSGQNRILPVNERSSTGNIQDLIDQTKKKKTRKNVLRRRCCILCLGITLALLLAGILATILALLLRQSSTSSTSSTITTSITKNGTNVSTTSTLTLTSSTTTTETTSVCTSTGYGTLLSLNETNPSGSVWTHYQFNFTATNVIHNIMFGFKNENNRQYYLDDVSVIDNSASSIELLQNSNFENSTTTSTGWLQWCTSTCSGHQGIITTGANCYSGNCFEDNCYASSGLDFIGQSFNTVIGNTYAISFMLKLGGSGTTTNNAFYADVV